MHAFMTAFRKTWLATALFAVVAAVSWSLWLGWDSAQEAILPTIILSPILWWWLVARTRHPGLLRGLLAGVLIGPATQALPQILPMIWQSLRHPGLGNGEQQAIAMVTVYFDLMVGVFSMPIGGLVGLIAVAIQRRRDRSAPAAVAVSNKNGATGVRASYKF